jgi:phage terminase large subunit
VAVLTDTPQHSYTPRGVLRQVITSKDAELLVSGPAGTGKSMACLEKLHLLALTFPGMHGLIVRKTLASLGSTALRTWRQRVVKEALAAKTLVYYGGSSEEPPQYRYANGSMIAVGGMDKPTRIMSSEYDIVYAQEATELTIDDWEAITTRLRYGRMPWQQLLADCNPDTPYHWLKMRVEAGTTAMLESRHEDNPTLFEVTLDGEHRVTPFGASYIGKLDALTGVRYLRLRRGIWAAAEGLVYEEWDPAKHLIPRFDVPETWRRFWTVDFGFTNPFVLQWWAIDPDDRLFMYREIYRTQRTVDQHANDAMRLVADELVASRTWRWREPKPSWIVCDHDAEGRAVLERELHMRTKNADKAVTRGIQLVQARLRPAKDGHPRLFVMRDSTVYRDPELVDAKKPTSTAEEMVGYVWERGPGGQTKENPAKTDDHGCDAMRYGVAQVDGGARPNVRFV